MGIYQKFEEKWKRKKESETEGEIMKNKKDFSRRERNISLDVTACKGKGNPMHP